MEDGEKLNFLKLRNVIVHGLFFVFVAIYLGGPVVNSLREFDGNINGLFVNTIIVVLFIFICIWYPISKYLLGQNHIFKKQKSIRVVLLDIPCVIGLVLAFLYPWYTVLNYFLGFTPYFKQDKVVRLVFLDIPFLLSLLFLTYLRFFDNSTGDASVIVIVPVFGYYPYSIMYYILAPLVILGYQGLKPAKWTKKSTRQFIDRIIWGVLFFLIISTAFVSFVFPTDAVMLMSGCWFPLVYFFLGFWQKQVFKRLLLTDIPFLISAVFIGFNNLFSAIGGYVDAELFYSGPMLGFYPFSVYYFLAAFLLLLIQWINQKINLEPC